MIDVLTKNTQTRRVAPNDGATTTFTLAAGTSDVNSVSVDTLGYGGCQFKVLVGAMASTAVCDIALESSTDNSTFTAVTGGAITQLTDTKDDKVVIIDYPSPAKRYLRLAFNRGTGNTTIDGVLATLYNPTAGATEIHSTVDQRVIVTPGN